MSARAPNMTSGWGGRSDPKEPSTDASYIQSQTVGSDPSSWTAMDRRDRPARFDRWRNGASRLGVWLDSPVRPDGISSQGGPFGLHLFAVLTCSTHLDLAFGCVLCSPLNVDFVRTESKKESISKSFQWRSPADAHLCVQVLFSRVVSKPILRLSKPAWAIMIPLSMQKLLKA
jgi:hypothetical protein